MMRDTPYSSLRIKSEHRPLYAIVAQRLTEEIAGGAFFDQDKLPSEEKLGRMFGVSRATIREALSVLEKQGQIRRVQGLGTIITHKEKIPIGSGLERLSSYTEYVSRYGLTPGTSGVEFRWEETDSKQQQIFSSDVSTVGILVRTRTADGEPLMISEDIIPIHILGPGFQIEDLGESLFAFLEKRGVVLAYSEMHLTAKVADAVEAERLAVMDGAPLLVIDEVYYSNQNKAVLASSNIYRVDRWDLKLYRTPENR